MWTEQVINKSIYVYTPICIYIYLHTCKNRMEVMNLKESREKSSVWEGFEGEKGSEKYN